MTPEELKEIEERYSMSLKTFSLNNLARLGVDVRGEILDLLAYIKELESRISEHERICSLRTLADGMNKLCPDLVEELIKRVNEYSKKRR